jgi:hypothetical protein
MVERHEIAKESQNTSEAAINQKCEGYLIYTITEFG